jgi:hypothetical protein
MGIFPYEADHWLKYYVDYLKSDLYNGTRSSISDLHRFPTPRCSLGLQAYKWQHVKINCKSTPHDSLKLHHSNKSNPNRCPRGDKWIIDIKCRLVRHDSGAGPPKRRSLGDNPRGNPSLSDTNTSSGDAGISSGEALDPSSSEMLAWPVVVLLKENPSNATPMLGEYSRRLAAMFDSVARS